MRCEDVIRELAVPGQGQDAAALAEHLRHCPMCAAWSARMASFDQLWARTRPADPSPEQWDAVWNRISRSLDAAPAHSREMAESTLPHQTPHSPIRLAPGTALETFQPGLQPIEVQRGLAPAYADPVANWFWSKSPRQRFLVGTAAAVGLIAFGLALFSPAPRTRVQAPPTYAQVDLHGGPVDPSEIPTVIGSVDIEEGELVVIRSTTPQPNQAVSEYEIVRTEPDAGIDSWYVMFNAVESMANPVVAVR